MRIYTVHDRFDSVGHDGDAVAVREGFNWPAFMFTGLWALWHRLWRVFVIMAVVFAALEGAIYFAGADPTTAAAAALGYGLIIGFGANDWRRAGLARRGWRQAGVVAAVNPDAALRRHYDLHGVPAPPDEPPACAKPEPRPAGQSPSGDGSFGEGRG